MVGRRSGVGMPMSDQDADGVGVTHEVAIAAKAKVHVKMDAILITLEEQLAPIFREMDLPRLLRIAEGEELILPGVKDVPKGPAQTIVRHYYDERVREEDQELTRESINVARRGLITSWIAIGISIIAAIAAIVSAMR